MRHCYIDFGEELFRAFQCGDWEKEDNVETAINAVLKGVKAIYAGNSVNITKDEDTFFQASFDTQYANADNAEDEHLRLVVFKVHDTLSKGYWYDNNVRQAFEVIIEHGDKLVLEKHGKVAHIRWAMECQ